jgi:hypothetical protein
MRIITFILVMCIASACGEIAPPAHYETVRLPVVKTFPEYDYILDPYHEFLSEVPPMKVYAREDQLLVEYKEVHKDVGSIPYVFDIKSVDTVHYRTERIQKIRYTVQDTKPVPAFMQKQYTFEVFNGFLVVDNKYIYCTNKSANKAVELIDKGIISERNPYIHTMSRMEPLDSVAKNFKTSQDMLLKWNPHLRYGYSIGSQVRIHWVPTELR